MTSELVRAAPRGAPLLGVSYEMLEWEEISSKREFDPVSIAVTLEFGSDNSFRLHWLVKEGFECLTTLEWAEGDPTPRTLVIDVSSRWGNLLGKQVVDQHLSFQQTEWGVQPWSCRLDFDSGQHLVVALGELAASGRSTYIPDALLITASRELASAYWPQAAESSAWGA